MSDSSNQVWNTGMSDSKSHTFPLDWNPKLEVQFRGKETTGIWKCLILSLFVQKIQGDISSRWQLWHYKCCLIYYCPWFQTDSSILYKWNLWEYSISLCRYLLTISHHARYRESILHIETLVFTKIIRKPE